MAAAKKAQTDVEALVATLANRVLSLTFRLSGVFFPAASAMAARGELAGKGWRTPEQLITGAHFDRLIWELAESGVRFTLEEA